MIESQALKNHLAKQKNLLLQSATMVSGSICISFCHFTAFSFPVQIRIAAVDVHEPDEFGKLHKNIWYCLSQVAKANEYFAWFGIYNSIIDMCCAPLGWS